LADEDEISLKLEAMLSKRLIKKGDDSVSQVLIQWKGKGLEDATWEEEFNIRN